MRLILTHPDARATSRRHSATLAPVLPGEPPEAFFTLAAANRAVLAAAITERARGGRVRTLEEHLADYVVVRPARGV